MADTLTRSSEPDLTPLDVYSQVVVSVAEQLTPGSPLCRFPDVGATGGSRLERGRRWSSRTTVSCSPTRTSSGRRKPPSCVRRRHHRAVPSSVVTPCPTWQ